MTSFQSNNLRISACWALHCSCSSETCLHSSDVIMHVESPWCQCFDQHAVQQSARQHSCQSVKPSTFFGAICMAWFALSLQLTCTACMNTGQNHPVFPSGNNALILNLATSICHQAQQAPWTVECIPAAWAVISPAHEEQLLSPSHSQQAKQACMCNKLKVVLVTLVLLSSGAIETLNQNICEMRDIPDQKGIT